MYSNSYGECFRITTFGESHGAAVGVIIDGRGRAKFLLSVKKMIWWKFFQEYLKAKQQGHQ